MEKNEVINLVNSIEKQNAINKVGYWQHVGTCILGDELLSAKWCQFVEMQANNDFMRGALIDETLQIMSMIKANLPFEMIAQTISQIPSGETIIDSYLGAFVHPEILDSINTILNQKKR